ncbi:hypothetical protein GCM10027261_06240 [Geodermatophilus arenarius]|uniref:Uncharacterized protein n=1 Tax=Geodermatophilus arenarius TaxID=1137990 RepID=A0ABV9LEU6_9ACTN
MCGACGPGPAEDWASPVLGSPAARSAAAAVVGAAAPRGVRVRAVPGGWTVARPTGGTTVAGTLTRLVEAAAADPGAEVDLPPAAGAHVPVGGRRPVTLVHGDAVPGAVDTRDVAWPHRVTGARAPVVLTARERPEEVLDLLLADPLRRSVRVAGLESATLAGWRGPAARLPGVPAAVPRDRVPALAALLALRLAGRGPHERTRTRVAVDGTPLTLDALGRRVLALHAGEG